MITHITANSYHYLKTLPDESVDSVVTDSPYGLGKEPDPILVLQDWIDHGYHEIKGVGFMGKAWDAFVPQPALWKECLRVLKPGGYLLSFFGTRTYDWGCMAIRIAGFEIRDQIAWVYGSGFPKSSNQHNEYEGWGTALKPAMEPMVVARKPLIGTVAQNLQKFGTGAINIDGCRVPLDGFKSKPNGRPSLTGLDDRYDKTKANLTDDVGRWPANVIHDGSEDVLQAFPDAAGQQGDLNATGKPRPTVVAFGDMAPPIPHKARIELNKSASRFFYCAKASRAEKDFGLAHLPKKQGGQLSNTSGQHITRRDGGQPGYVHNPHPTVKPIALMRYLVRLVTPVNGVVLDPFSGTGTTGVAAKMENMSAILIDMDADNTIISQARVQSWGNQSSLF